MNRRPGIESLMLDTSSLLSRRDVMRLALLGAAGAMVGDRLTLGQTPASLSSANTPPFAKAPAKSVIQIWMWGGPCHIDTFDPKPEAGQDYTGPLNKPIATNIDGIRIGELMPLLAKHADKYAILRGMTHGNNGHETASYLVQTGRTPGERQVFPGVGAVVSRFKGYDAGYKGLIPPYIVLTELQGRFSEAGFMGGKYRPFATGGDPSRTPFAVEGVIVPGISPERQQARRALLHDLDTLAQTIGSDPQIVGYEQCEQQAYELILGDAGKVFDLTQEPQAVREKYGMSKFGQSCLVARRLVERGVPYITINYPGWDTHKQHFQAMRRQLPDMDKALSSLLEDLSSRGLLDSTIIWWSGEFGRTPKVLWDAPWNGGRGHHGKVFSALLAGGGFKGGVVVGASDAKGEDVKDRPIYPTDVIGSIYERLGINPDARLPNPEGLDTRVMPLASDNVKSAGRLKEIM